SATNITNKLSKSYGTDAEVLAFERLEYFIRDTGRRTRLDQPIHGLFVRRLSNADSSGGVPAGLTAYELLEGVENMQLEYGVDTLGDDRTADVYRSAAAMSASDWENVVTVRVNLLLQGNEDRAVGTSGEQVQTLSFMGTPAAQDGRLRQVFSST